MFTEQQITYKVRTDQKWVERAILAIYEQQTTREQEAGVTVERNGVGFDATEAGLGTYLANWIQSDRPLSGQWVERARTIALRHVKQLAKLANEKAETVDINS